MDDVYGLYMYALETWYLLLVEEEHLLLVQEEDVLLVQEEDLHTFCIPSASQLLINHK